MVFRTSPGQPHIVRKEQEAMHKLAYGAGATVCLIVAAAGVYLAMQTFRQERTLPSLAEEEQESPGTVPFPLGDLVYHTPPAPLVPEDAEFEVTTSAFEPIIVEGTTVDLPPVTEIGGATLPGQGIGGTVAPVQQPPRPDEEPGQELKMPFAEESVEQWLGARLWTALSQFLKEHETQAVQPPQTQEPPVAEPPLSEQPQILRPLFPPAMDYHQQHPSCPYTGRCPLPYHPAPPVTDKR
jgi:hypothetical protein